MQLQHPVIAVIGQPDAGKSTLMATLSGTTPAPPFDAAAATVLNMACVRTDVGQWVYLIEHLDAYMPLDQMGAWVAANRIGFLLMVEASQPYEFLPSRKHLWKIWVHKPPHSIDALKSIPVVIAANKQDHPDAWNPEDMGIAFMLRHADVPLMACTASDLASCKRVVTALINHAGWDVA